MKTLRFAGLWDLILDAEDMYVVSRRPAGRVAEEVRRFGGRTGARTVSLLLLGRLPFTCSALAVARKYAFEIQTWRTIVTSLVNKVTRAKS